MGRDGKMGFRVRARVRGARARGRAARGACGPRVCEPCAPRVRVCACAPGAGRRARRAPLRRCAGKL